MVCVGLDRGSQRLLQLQIQMLVRTREGLDRNRDRYATISEAMAVMSLRFLSRIPAIISFRPVT